MDYTEHISIYFMSKAITADTLRDDEEYEEILEDMREECSKFGMYAHHVFICLNELFLYCSLVEIIIP